MSVITDDILAEEKHRVYYDEFSRLNNELATAQRELVKKNAELEKLNIMKNQFLGMAAHDLRNPLNAIIPLSNILLDDTMELSKEKQLKFLEMINSSGKHMLEIINNLLDISVIETGNLELHFEKIEITSFLSNIIDVNNIMASKKELEIVFTHEDIPEILMDASKLEQVLSNLLSNAIKFTYNNKKIFVNLTTKDKNLIITIEDQGQGIPATELSKLFKPFSTTSIKGTIGEKSTGLGLAIVHKLIQSLSGEIAVESVLGVGSKFSISLPLSLYGREM